MHEHAWIHNGTSLKHRSTFTKSRAVHDHARIDVGTSLKYRSTFTKRRAMHDHIWIDVGTSLTYARMLIGNAMHDSHENESDLNLYV